MIRSAPIAMLSIVAAVATACDALSFLPPRAERLADLSEEDQAEYLTGSIEVRGTLTHDVVTTPANVRLRRVRADIDAVNTGLLDIEISSMCLWIRYVYRIDEAGSNRLVYTTEGGPCASPQVSLVWGPGEALGSSPLGARLTRPAVYESSIPEADEGARYALYLALSIDGVRSEPFPIGEFTFE